jgi:hypothetical protein
MFVMPKANNQEDYLDRWARTYSEVTNTNLCSYFDWFKIKITDATRKFCKSLKAGVKSSVVYTKKQQKLVGFLLSKKLT